MRRTFAPDTVSVLNRKIMRLDNLRTISFMHFSFLSRKHNQIFELINRTKTTFYVLRNRSKQTHVKMAGEAERSKRT